MLRSILIVGFLLANVGQLAAAESTAAPKPLVIRDSRGTLVGRVSTLEQPPDTFFYGHPFTRIVRQIGTATVTIPVQPNGFVSDFIQLYSATAGCGGTTFTFPQLAESFTAEGAVHGTTLYYSTPGSSQPAELRYTLFAPVSAADCASYGTPIAPDWCCVDFGSPISGSFAPTQTLDLRTLGLVPPFRVD
jgi:hypothetical protein